MPVGMLFHISATTGRGKIVQGEAEDNFLPVYNARTINPEYHSHLLYYKLIRQTIATVTKQQKIQSAKG